MNNQISKPLIEIKNPSHLVKLIKGLSANDDTYQKKYGSMSELEMSELFAFATYGFNQEQLNLGLTKLLKHGYFPTPALFSAWCNGFDGFNDPIFDSYIGKHAALGQIIKWQSNPNTPITQAMKQAYDDTYHLWQSVHSSSDMTRAELAFKDSYEHMVKELVKQRIKCQAYVPPVVIVHKQPKQTHRPASRDFALKILANIGKQIKGLSA